MGLTAGAPHHGANSPSCQPHAGFTAWVVSPRAAGLHLSVPHNAYTVKSMEALQVRMHTTDMGV